LYPAESNNRSGCKKGKHMKYENSGLKRGYTNKILTIDLNSGAIDAPALDSGVRDFFTGGRGLGLYLLHRKYVPGMNALAPGNPLIFSPGPLGGVPHFPGAGKCMAVSLSPLTGIPGASNFGGHFGAFLKYAGFDALEISGVAEKDTMIVIDAFKGEISLMDAPAIDHVFDLEQVIIERFSSQGHKKKNIVFVTTGFGAANTSYGCINSHYYDPTKPACGTKGLFRTKQAGRTGLGTVMMHKKVRAVVILATFPRGDNPYGAHDWTRVKEAGARLHKVVREVDPQSLRMNRKGSAGLIAFMNKESYQSLPVKNYQLGTDPRADNICGKYYEQHLFEHRGNDGCFPGCNLGCTKGGLVTLKTGRKKGSQVWVDGPEYETAAAFGSNLDIWNAEFIMEANWLCDDYGIDTITAAVIIAFLMECFQKGYLTKEDTGDLNLTWGNEEAALEFLHRIARQESELARVAGKGMEPLIGWISARYMQRTGKPDPGEEIKRFAMHTKGLPFSLYRTHRSLSMQASYAAASDIGAHHAAAWLVKVDLLGAFPTFQDKATALITYPRVRLGNDNLGLCKLPWVDVFNPASGEMKNTDIYINPASQEIYADFYNGMLGADMTWQEIFARTDRDINLQRVMNALVFGRETRNRDWIPERAIGPTDDALFDAEKDYHDGEVSKITGKPLPEVQNMSSSEKRQILMDHRKKELSELIQAYYQKRGWSSSGIPSVDTLQQLGLWQYLSQEAQEGVIRLNGGS
jgi:aldehyde:ferredoxin oxidoreductase